MNFGTPVAGNSIQLNGNIISGLEVQSWDPATNTLTTNQTTSMNSGIEVRFIDIEGVEVIPAPGKVVSFLLRNAFGFMITMEVRSYLMELLKCI
ncbi:MAG: hypothetical protein CM15mV120_310 [uncultured marine virus]|nr:MAG: hypothetical protein CM15mV120_310 [uncultured marine virus]